MSQEIRRFEPIRSVGVTAGSPPSTSTLDWLRQELAAGKTKDVIASLNAFGNTVTIGTSALGKKLGAEATKREVGQVLELLGKFSAEAPQSAGMERAHGI